MAKCLKVIISCKYFKAKFRVTHPLEEYSNKMRNLNIQIHDIFI